ncbi:restriction endonuclease subunit S [Bifidobacterium longum]
MMTEQAKVPAIRFAGFTDPWEQRKLGELFDYEQPQPYIVRGTEYDDSFPTPVLTAGQSFVLGYTNEKQGIKMASPEHPVIIFDDFTTSSHFVDFPFKVKSSAIKLLTLRDKNEDIHFAYQVLQNIAYTPVSHERHWISKFATFATLMPECKSEMQAIGHFMSNLDGLITLHQRKYDKLVIFKKSMLEKMFPKDGESVPEIRFAGFTDPWEQRKLGEIVSIGAGAPPSAFSAGNFLYVKVDDLNESSHFQFDSAQRVDANTAVKPIRKGSIIFAKRGAAILGNKVRVLGKTAYIDTNMMALEPRGVDADFLWLFINQTGLYRIADTSTIPQINNKHIEPYPVDIPNMAEQQAIGTFFSRLDDLITLHQRKLELLQDIKKSLLDKMFV